MLLLFVCLFVVYFLSVTDGLVSVLHVFINKVGLNQILSGPQSSGSFILDPKMVQVQVTVTLRTPASCRHSFLTLSLVPVAGSASQRKRGKSCLNGKRRRDGESEFTTTGDCNHRRLPDRQV